MRLHACGERPKNASSNNQKHHLPNKLLVFSSTGLHWLSILPMPNNCRVADYVLRLKSYYIITVCMREKRTHEDSRLSSSPLWFAIFTCMPIPPRSNFVRRCFLEMNLASKRGKSNPNWQLICIWCTTYQAKKMSSMDTEMCNVCGHLQPVWARGDSGISQ